MTVSPGGEYAPDSSPRIARGQRVAAESRVVADADGGQRVEFALPITEPMPPQEASRASEEGTISDSPPIGDVAVASPGPDVWEALPDDAEAKAGAVRRGTRTND
jgi:hypothetical protein